MSKHSPFPWRVDQVDAAVTIGGVAYTGPQYAIMDANNDFVALLGQVADTDLQMVEQSIADARLIVSLEKLARAARVGHTAELFGPDGIIDADALFAVQQEARAALLAAGLLAIRDVPA